MENIQLLLNLLMMVALVVGTGLLVTWQIRTPLLSSLDRCPVRRNRLPLFFPFFQLFVWLVAVALLTSILNHVLAKKPQDVSMFAQNATLTALEVAMAVFFLLTAQFAFVRGLKGFGLQWRTVFKDFFWAAVNLITAYPAILLLLWLTVQGGQWIVGPEFELQEHQSLLELNGGGPLWIRVFLVVMIVMIVPIFEELLFRGLMQSTLAAYLSRPWAAIALTSILFAMMHPLTHFFGIFALSCCIGYAYEKSGSLLRPVFVHILFNSTSVVAALLS